MSCPRTAPVSFFAAAAERPRISTLASAWHRARGGCWELWAMADGSRRWLRHPWLWTVNGNLPPRPDCARLLAMEFGFRRVEAPCLACDRPVAVTGRLVMNYGTMDFGHHVEGWYLDDRCRRHTNVLIERAADGRLVINPDPEE